MAFALSEFDSREFRPKTSLWQLPVLHALAGCIFFAAAFWNHVELYIDKIDVGLDPVVVIKLSFSGLGLILGVYAFLSDLRVREVVFSWPGNLMLCIFTMYVGSSLFSSGKLEAVVSSSSILGTYLLTIAMALQLGRTTALQLLFYASACFIVGSWLVYFVQPEIGVLMEPISEGGFRRRMSGLSHSNTLGQYCGINLLLGIVLYFSYKKRSWLLIGICLLSVAALIHSLSRASMLALLMAVVVAYRSHFITRRFVQLSLVFGALLAAGLVVYFAEANIGQSIEQRMSMLSKSGDAEEITSGTGRSQIWAKTISLIKQRPAVGYGPATSRELLENFSSYAHNLILNIALSSGVPGGLLALTMCVARLLMMFKYYHPAADGLVAFILVNGVFENTIFSTICGFPTLAWTLGLTWFALEKHCVRHE